MDISIEYWNKLAEQTVLIASLLCGFSIAVIANILVSELNTRLVKIILGTSTLAASLFLVTIFAMTSLLFMTTKGYPVKIDSGDIFLPQVLGSSSFFLGIISLVAVISLAGWVKSKGMGRFTTILGLVTIILILMMAIR